MKNTLETRLGIFFTLAIISAFILMHIIGGTDFFTGGYNLRARFSTVQELKLGDPVKMAGIPIGRVDRIEPDGDKVEVLMLIRSKFKIRTDSKATIKFAGLMGQNFISINIGATTNTFVSSPVQTIDVVEQPDMSALMAKLENVASGIENVTKSFSGDSIQNILGPFTDFMTQNRANLTLMISNIKGVSQGLAEGKGTVGKLLTDESLYNTALSAATNLNSTAEDVKALMSDAKSMMGNARTAIDEAQGAIKDARGVMAGVNRGEGSVGKLLKDETLYKEITAASVNLRQIMEKINQGQGTVGKLVNDESFLKNVKMTLQKVDKATEGLEDQGPLSILGVMANSLF
jgi:phospholipid/cholesterol/gamma-HCH transport system substrate-binding protein